MDKIKVRRIYSKYLFAKTLLILQILASAAVLLICAAQAQKLKRQDDQYDYDDQAQHQQPEIQSARARPQNFQQASKQQPHPKPIGKDGETSTWIPILHYNKEQENDGSYKTK